MIEEVAKALGPDICARTAFVGGVTTGLLVTDDFAREGVRLASVALTRARRLTTGCPDRAT